MEQKRHTCKLCKMSFASGRVLGGHEMGHAARNSVKRELLCGAGGIKLEAFGIGSCDGGLSGNPRGSREEREFQLERSGQGRNLVEFLAFCPVRRKRSARVFVSPSDPSPEELDWVKLLPMVSPVSGTEQDVDEAVALSLLLLSRGLRASNEQITEETAPIAVSGFEQTTKENVKGCGELGFLSRDAEIGKRACESRGLQGGYEGGSAKKPKLHHDWNCNETNNQMKLTFRIKIGCGGHRIVCPTSNGKENKPMHTCRTCLKVFKSVKALYGHQRVH